MAPTTVTTIVLILFALVVFALTAYAWFGSWDFVVQRPVRGSASSSEDEIEVAVLQMRRAIEEYERRQRHR